MKKKEEDKKVKCPKCGHPHEVGKQFCQKCCFNIAYWIKTGLDYREKKADCLPFTKGF